MSAHGRWSVPGRHRRSRRGNCRAAYFHAAAVSTNSRVTERVTSQPGRASQGMHLPSYLPASEIRRTRPPGHGSTSGQPLVNLWSTSGPQRGGPLRDRPHQEPSRWAGGNGTSTEDERCWGVHRDGVSGARDVVCVLAEGSIAWYETEACSTVGMSMIASGAADDTQNKRRSSTLCLPLRARSGHSARDGGLSGCDILRCIGAPSHQRYLENYQVSH
jgi:hypothetical protein